MIRYMRLGGLIRWKLIPDIKSIAINVIITFCYILIMIRFRVLSLLKIRSPPCLSPKGILSPKLSKKSKMTLLPYMDYKHDFFCRKYQAKSKYTTTKSISSNIIIQRNIKNLY
jgi:hypothetical protein